MGLFPQSQNSHRRDCEYNSLATARLMGIIKRRNSCEGHRPVQRWTHIWEWHTAGTHERPGRSSTRWPVSRTDDASISPCPPANTPRSLQHRHRRFNDRVPGKPTSASPSTNTPDGWLVGWSLTSLFSTNMAMYVCILRAAVQPTPDPHTEAFIAGPLR